MKSENSFRDITRLRGSARMTTSGTSGNVGSGGWPETPTLPAFWSHTPPDRFGTIRANRGRVKVVASFQETMIQFKRAHKRPRS